VTKATGMLSSTCSGPRSELQRTLDGEYGVRYRNPLAVQAVARNCGCTTPSAKQVIPKACCDVSRLRTV